MITKIEVKRIFNFDDATLIQRSDALLGSLNRDIADLGYRNITAAVLASFANRIDAFRETDTDVEWQGAISDIVGKKNQKRAELHIKIGTIRNMAQNVYGTAKGIYSSFGFDNLDRLDDNNYVRAAKRVYRMATAKLSDLSAEGLTAAQLTDLQADIVDFDNKIDEVDAKEEERDLATQTRITTANELYRTAKKLSGIGKTHYLSRDEAKYNDYVLFPEPDSDTEADTDPLPPTP